MLDIVIVGAGIAGLAAAVSLRRAGHHIRVFERSSLINEVGAAINVPPNASRLLIALGLDPNAARFVPARSITLVDGRTCDVLSFAPQGERLERLYGAGFYFAHRVDLHEALRSLAIGEGLGTKVEIQLRKEVVAYGPDIASVMLASGEVIKGDIVIAADGIHSKGVEAVLGRVNSPRQERLYNGCYRFLIPAATLESDPEAKWWNKDCDGRLRIYMAGPAGNRLVSYPCRNNEIHNFVGMFYSDEMVSATQEDWLAPVDKSHVLETFRGFHPQIMAVFRNATEVKQWPLLFRPPIPTWIKGNLVLMGDAAHPMLPHQGQGGAQAIEDGVALGIALYGATPEQVADRLKAYEKSRINRASAIQVLSNAGQDQVEMIHEEVAKYSDFVPKNPQECSQYNFGHDLVRECISCVRDANASFEIPLSFFHSSPFLPES